MSGLCYRLTSLRLETSLSAVRVCVASLLCLIRTGVPRVFPGRNRMIMMMQKVDCRNGRLSHEYTSNSESDILRLVSEEKKHANTELLTHQGALFFIFSAMKSSIINVHVTWE